MRALITGGSGFVGANLARRLLRDGHQVHLLLRPSHQPWRVSEIAGDVTIHEINLEDRDAVNKLVAAVRPDAVFHLAAFGAYSTQTGFEQMVSTNLLGTASLIDASVAAGVGAFVQTGSSSEYGYKDHPAEEIERLEPNSHYAITKSAATHYCQWAARKMDIHAVTLRLYSIYGPYEEPSRLIPTLLMYGMQGKLPPLVSPRTARDFVYVDDAVDAMLRVAMMPDLPRGAVYNVCSGSQRTLAEVVSLARELLNIKAEPEWSSMEQRVWDTDVWVGSAAAMERDTGWRAAVSWREGLARTIAWFQHHPEWLNYYREKILA
jgi:nucleoside-diphosphate-sugar epimerase